MTWETVGEGIGAWLEILGAGFVVYLICKGIMAVTA